MSNERSSDSVCDCSGRDNVTHNNTNYSTTHSFGHCNHSFDIYGPSSVETQWVFLAEEKVGNETEKR